jgi:DNA-binding CsgD family transcriptional regulator
LGANNFRAVGMEKSKVLLRARLARRADGQELAAGLSLWDPALQALGSALGDVMGGLVQTERLRGGCVEEARLSGGWQVSATGASVFISDAVADAYLASPTPFFAAQLMSRIMAGEKDVVLDAQGIARGNARDGLNLFVLGFTHRYGADEPPILRPLLTRAIEHFVYAHRGYKLRRMLREDTYPIADVMVASGMTVRHDFAELGRKVLLAEPGAEPHLFPSTTVSMLFNHSPPQVRYTSAERRVLELAVDGMADGDIAEEIGVTASTIKQTWRAVYERTLRQVPLALPSKVGTAQDGVRGQEKRRHLLAYLRDHPQELRPHL